MDIKQIRSDYDNGVVISRATWAELITRCEQADAVLAGRQQTIGALNMRIAELEQRGVAVPPVATVQDERELDLYDEIECDLPYLFGRASLEGHQVGQELAAQVRAKMQQARITGAVRTSLLPMHEDGDSLLRWYFDCDTFYIDVEKDEHGVLSIYCRDRSDNKEGWLDRAAQSAPGAVPAQDRNSNCNYIGQCGCKSPCTVTQTSAAPADEKESDLSSLRSVVSDLSRYSMAVYQNNSNGWNAERVLSAYGEFVMYEDVYGAIEAMLEADSHAADGGEDKA